MLHILGRIAYEHDLGLVAVAGLLCVLACWTAVTLLQRARLNESGRMRWVAAAGLVFGAGIWAMHFVAMLAWRTSLPVGYDVLLTGVSIVIAILMSALGFALIFRPPWAVAGGALVGLGIGAMHYVGMSALEGPFDVVWDARYMVASVIAGAAFGALGVHLGITIRNTRGRAAAAASLGFGIFAMHFTGMSAVTLIPDPAQSFHSVVLVPDAHAAAVAAVALLIVALGMMSALLDRYVAWLRFGEDARLRAHIAELEATQTRLEVATGELQVALDKASAAARAKAAFLAAMGHELRTPLNAIIGFSDVILSKTLGPVGHPRYAEYIGDIRQSGANLLALINNVLDLARLDAGNTELVEEPLSIEGLMEDVRDGLQSEAERAGVQVWVDCLPGLPDILADRRRLQQAVSNLLANAIKFNRPGGQVLIAASSGPEGVRVDISDTGIGIAEHDLQRALDRFEQVDGRLGRKYEGAGLGLPLARELLALHDARLSVASKPDEGTTVSFVIPPSRVLLRARSAAA